MEARGKKNTMHARTIVNYKVLPLPPLFDQVLIVFLRHDVVDVPLVLEFVIVGSG
jgi:hypothetical protein